MAYCASCGAYIPDGQSTCLACGYNEAEQKQAEQKKTDGSQTAAKQYSFDQEELHRKLEEQRRRQQEENRRWAEQEHERRQKQEANRQWAQEEYQRRQQERAQQTVRSAPVERASAGVHSSQGTGNKALAVLSYFSVLFALPYFFAPQDKFAMFHAKQGLRLFLFGLAIDILGSIFSVGWVAALIRIYLMFKGISAASEGKMEPLPYIGTLELKKKQDQ